MSESTQFHLAAPDGEVMPDAQLAEAVVEAAKRVSYFNATDDIHCWNREEKERKAAERELNSLADAAIKRGLYVDVRNMLTYDVARRFEAIRPTPAPADGSFYELVNKVAGVQSK